jgi:hypothetical protein
MRLPWQKPKKKSTDSINFKKLRVVVDQMFKDTDEDRQEMTRYLKRYKGEWWDKSKLKNTDSTVQANLFFSTVMTIAPLITDNKPVWAARSRKSYMQNYMDAYSIGLEYLWDKLDLDSKTFRWILDALIMKTGIAKVWFNPDSEFGGEIEVDIVDPRNFFCAPGYEDIWDSPMCGVRIPKPLSWVYMKYPEKADEVKPESGDQAKPEDEDWEKHTKSVDVYEVWLKSSEIEDYFINEEGNEVDEGDEGAKKGGRAKYPNGRVVVFTKDVLLDDMPSPYKHGKPCYVALYDYINPHELIGQGEGNQIEELTKSFNRNLQLLDTWTRDYCDPPLLIDTSSGLDPDQVKEEYAKGGAVFAYNGMSMQGRAPIEKVSSAQANPTVTGFMTGLSKLIEEISGVTDITKGMTTKSQRQSATEISTLVESAYTRTRQRVRNFEWSVKRLLYLTLSNMQQFYTETKSFSMNQDNNINYYNLSNSKDFAAQTINPNLGQIPQAGVEEDQDEAQITKDYERFVEEFGDVDEIYAEFDLDIQTNSTLPMDKQSLANLFLRLLELASANPVLGMPMWKATLGILRVPRYKEIISEMEKLYEKSQTPPGAPGAQGQEAAGPMSLMAQLQGA